MFNPKYYRARLTQLEERRARLLRNGRLAEASALNEDISIIARQIEEYERTLRLSVCPNSVEYRLGSETILSFDGLTTLDAVERALASINLANLKDHYETSLPV